MRTALPGLFMISPMLLLLHLLQLISSLAQAAILPMDKYQMHLIAEMPEGDRFCRIATAGFYGFVVCDQEQPDSWTTMSLTLPLSHSGPWDPSKSGTDVNLAFRPSAVPSAKVNSYSGTIMTSPSSRIDPFFPPPSPGQRPSPMFVPLLTATLEVTLGLAGEDLTNGFGGSVAFSLKALDGTWYDEAGGILKSDAYCTVRDLDASSKATVSASINALAINALSQFIICDRNIAAESAIRFRLQPAGIGSTTSLVLMSHHTMSLCGYHQDKVTCSGEMGYNICCAGSNTTYGGQGTPAVPWWTYLYKEDNPPLTEVFSFKVQAWDANTHSPMRYWQVDANGDLLAPVASQNEEVLNPSSFHMSVLSPKDSAPGAAIGSGSSVLLWSDDLFRFCRPHGADGQIKCTGTLDDALADKTSYTFTITRFDCPRAEYLCQT